MDTTIRFVLNGEPVTVADAAPTTTLLAWLRYRRRLTGTKEGCAEGDCGACTVAVRDLRSDGSLRTRPINACIALLPMLHGKDVVTVERLAAPDGRLHPVQAAMADGHGSQCGFCTPGFVMSLYADYRAAPDPDEARVRDVLAGNLCRCTGYGPIVAAARTARAAARPDWDDADEVAACERLAELGADAPLHYAAGGHSYHAPTSIDAFAELVADQPDATVLSGATDVGLWVTKAHFAPQIIISTGRIEGFDRIEVRGGALVIAGGATIEALRSRGGALWPEMGELLRRFGGWQVRSAGTVGGNIANGSPIGDLPPALIAAGATLILRCRTERRTMPLEAFFLAYGRQDRRPGEFVEAVRVPLPADGAGLKCYKLSKRFDSDITAVLACIDVRVETGAVTACRVAFGGMAGIPKRASNVEAALLGQPWSEATIAAAVAALDADFTPLSDHRGSTGYRMQAAAACLRKYYIEATQPETVTRLVGPAALVA